DGLRPLCGRLERKRAEGAHGCRKGGATIGLRGRTFTSCPALCHAVIRARPQISNERGPSTAKRRARLRSGQAKTPAGGGLQPILTTPVRGALQKWQAGTEKRLASAEQRKCLSITSVVCGLLVLVRL